MGTQVQYRGGTTAEHATFTGAVREVTVDTDKDTLVVHDGVKAGGFPLAKEEIQTNLVSLSGVAPNSTNLGSFTGTIISDNGTIKSGLQDIETYLQSTDTYTGTYTGEAI